MCNRPAPPVPCRSRPARGFTVPELLVVVSILSILIALLFPSLQRARRRALVLASPIVFVGTDNRLHLTDPSGQVDLPMAVPTKMECPVCHSPPAWSPSGQSIAFRLLDEHGPATGILEPASGRLTRFREDGRQFVGWLDSGRFVDSDLPSLTVRDAGTGEVLHTVSLPRSTEEHPASLSAAPASAPEPFVGTVRKGGRSAVSFFRKDLTPGRRVWAEPGPSGVSVNAYPQVDPMGEFVAWSRQRPGGGDARSIALKPVSAPPDQPPAMIGEADFKSVYFCDWTEQGALLANATNDHKEWGLVVFDRDGRLLRRMATAVRPSKGVIASWRKYGHR